MFDPHQTARLAAEVFDEHAPAPLSHDISPAMRAALIALMAGPAELLPGAPHPEKWQAPGNGRLQRIESTTMSALANRGLVAIDPRRSIGHNRRASLTPRGRWLAHRAAGEAANQLMAALLRTERPEAR